LGTMFQPAVDWLSEERRMEFEEWKEELLGSVALIEVEA
jgi:origin recognition complex subunit 6